MTGPDDNGDDDALAGEYVLGLLAPSEAREVEARIASDPGFASLVAFWETRLAEFADEVEPVEPPAAVYDAIRKELFAEEDRPWWRRFGLGQLSAAAFAAAALLLLALNFGWIGPEVPPRPTLTAEIAAEDRSLVIGAVYLPGEEAFLVEQEAGGPPPGRVLELWLIPAGEAPVSLGVLPEESQTLVGIAPELQARLAGGILAVSDEPPGGSTTGAPTGAVLGTGPITNL